MIPSYTLYQVPLISEQLLEQPLLLGYSCQGENKIASAVKHGVCQAYKKV